MAGSPVGRVAVRRALPHALTALVALALPALLLGNGLWVLANGWYVHAAYARPGFPDDRHGLTESERTELAIVGLRSIQPLNRDGVGVLREARLPDGSLAFGEREIAHMADVRGLVGRILLAHAIAVGALVAAFAGLRALRVRAAFAGGLALGGGLTLVLVAALGVLMLASFDRFFVQFHEALFTGDSWRFRSTDTLLRLYPDAFWSDFGAALAILTVAQAVAVTWLAYRWLRRRGLPVLARSRSG
ncbi:MAG: DUF1461 domain-containing protein [Thermoleophilia bacterium]|nr:DUF1461 domain-containing protein [Thermoleophilia bacterium]